mmetsp:Transcript_6115/g.25616  ORF Transcript_6115/g.25616 Transcript_6115/m.25616 type:complete len:292 (-) Transcript_6115:1539-2414(-)
MATRMMMMTTPRRMMIITTDLLNRCDIASTRRRLGSPRARRRARAARCWCGESWSASPRRRPCRTRRVSRRTARSSTALGLWSPAARTGNGFSARRSSTTPRPARGGSAPRCRRLGARRLLRSSATGSTSWAARRTAAPRRTRCSCTTRVWTRGRAGRDCRGGCSSRRASRCLTHCSSPARVACCGCAWRRRIRLLLLLRRRRMVATKARLPRMFLRGRSSPTMRRRATTPRGRRRLPAGPRPRRAGSRRPSSPPPRSDEELERRRHLLALPVRGARSKGPAREHISSSCT